MQKNLLGKTAFIVAIMVVFAFGIIGIPQQWNGAGLKASLQERIHLGLDLKGGTHLILQVMVNDAVNAESDSAAERLKDWLSKAKATYGEVYKPDPAARPDQIAVKGLSPDASSELRTIVSERMPEYDLVPGPSGEYFLNMKLGNLNDIKERAVDQSIETIRGRVDTLGVSEPLIERHGLGQYQILVQLPGVDDPTRVKDMIQSTARLEVRQALDAGKPYPSEAEAIKAHGGMLPPNAVALPGSNLGTADEGEQKYYLISRTSVVAGQDIRHADSVSNPNTAGRMVNFNLTNAAGRRFAEFTNAHQENSGDPDHFLAIVLDNKVREVASIKSEIRDSGEIEGNFTEQSAKDLATLLNSGALPASIHYLQEMTVGPSLGADSIKQGVRAAIVGMIAVMLFMLIYYRAAGINADLALILNLIILLGFMGFFGATLTLPGIAGVILTVGMGVDSNVLIFERIREELRSGKTAAAAVDQGFSKAFKTIIDTHVTTIVSAFILIIFGTGPVKGFAVTLTFGLLANIFTAVFVSRVIFDSVLRRHTHGEALSI